MGSALTENNYSDLTALAKDVYERLDGNVVLGAPIGIGKATHMINAFYQLAKNNPNYNLEILSALSLNRPKLKTDLERRLLNPFFDRHFKDLPELEFASDVVANKLPSNVKVSEFYFKPGEMLRNSKAQQNALSTNYTHATRDLLMRGMNVICQMIGKNTDGDKVRYSLSSNPDITIDLQRLFREKTAEDGKPRFILGQVNSEMPFMPRDAEVKKDFFDYVCDDPSLYSSIFATPYQPISAADHMIGFYTSLLTKDDGTLQIGIGSLGDAVANALLVRHNHNDAYRALVEKTHALRRFPCIETEGGLEPFDKGLYGNTEMLVPGYLELKKGGVLKRRVYDDEHLQQLVNEGLDPNSITLDWLDGLVRLERISPHMTGRQVEYLKQWGLFKPEVGYENEQLTLNSDSVEANLKLEASREWIKQNALGAKVKNATLLHGGFFVGGHNFYDDLRNMPEEELNELNMTSVMFTNQIRGHEDLKLKQMKNARFINTCMKTTLSGASASDGLADGRVVSGVGGQFNFVTMGHDIPDARSILMMRSCRRKGASAVSNVIFNYGHITVPRHMRDVVITEYGIADLRAKNDSEIVDALLQVTDSRFQGELIKQAKKAGKLPENYQLPESAKNNTPEALNALLAEVKEHFGTFPFGCDLTEEEVLIGGALKQLKTNADKKWPLVKAIVAKIGKDRLIETKEHLERLGLYDVKTPKQWLLRKLVISVLPSR